MKKQTRCAPSMTALIQYSRIWGHDWSDLELMSDNWLDSNCSNRPVGTLDSDCDVDFKDFAILAENWLEGT